MRMLNMKQMKSDNEIHRDKILSDVDSWGILTLMTQMKDVYLHNLYKQRLQVSVWHTSPYKDSALENLDKFQVKFEEVYDREFKKIYDELERKYEQRTN